LGEGREYMYIIYYVYVWHEGEWRERERKSMFKAE
jgi:hypothetical protein